MSLSKNRSELGHRNPVEAEKLALTKTLGVNWLDGKHVDFCLRNALIQEVFDFKGRSNVFD